MGCDIHICVEQLYKGRWTLVNRVYSSGWQNRSRSGIARDRDYMRFAALAGVRGPGPEPKGLPKDISAGALMWAEQEGSDGHSHSFYTVLEAIHILLEVDEKEVDKYIGSDAYRYFRIDCDPDWNPIEEFRIVFWFDN